MLKFTKQSVIAFDFKEALSFEGETGPYAQYAVVRASNIFRKAGANVDTFATSRLRLCPQPMSWLSTCQTEREMKSGNSGSPPPRRPL